MFITPLQLSDSGIERTSSVGISSAPAVSVEAFNVNDESLFGPGYARRERDDSEVESRQRGNSIFVGQGEANLLF